MTRKQVTEYKTVWLDTEYKTLSGYAGNQYVGGYNFPGGGGFYYSSSGGPSVSGSVSISFPYPYNMVSVSIGTNLGEKSNSVGQYVAVPANSSYYKLYVSKLMEVRPYVVYSRPISNPQAGWQVYAKNTHSTVYSMSLRAKKL